MRHFLLFYERISLNYPYGLWICHMNHAAPNVMDTSLLGDDARARECLDRTTKLQAFPGFVIERLLPARVS